MMILIQQSIVHKNHAHKEWDTLDNLTDLPMICQAQGTADISMIFFSHRTHTRCCISCMCWLFKVRPMCHHSYHSIYNAVLTLRNLMILGICRWKLNRTPKKPVYNHVWYQQNQACIHPRSGKSPKLFTVQCKPDISRLVGSMERYRDISGSAIYRATAIWAKIQAKFSSALWAVMGPLCV